MENEFVGFHEIVGHDRYGLQIPIAGDRNSIVDWLKSAFYPILNQIGDSNPELLRKIRFIDLLFHKIEDNSFFGGIVLEKSLRHCYTSEILAPLYKRNLTVAAHHDFQKAFVDRDHKEERWLFSCSHKIFQDNNSSKEFSVQPSSTEEDLKKVGINNISGFQWLKRARENEGIEEAWTLYVENCRKFSINCIAGIPITIPNSKISTNGNSAFIGSLFVGLNEPDKNIARRQISIIVRHILPLALRCYGMQAIKEFTDKKQFERSHRMLINLQKPLDALMSAFNTVQSEAQEMNAILNSPERGLFKSHKLIAHIFQDNRKIPVSDYLSIISHHNYSPNPNDFSNLELLQRSFTFAICSIFGIEDELRDAQSHESFMQFAYSALRNVRHKAVHDELLFLLITIINYDFDKKEEFNTSLIVEELIQLQPYETNENAQIRFSIGLNNLKRFFFTPFKDIEEKWNCAPAFLAALGKNFRWNEIKALDNNMPNENTPFAQHPILNFLISISTYMKEKFKQKLDTPTFSIIDNQEQHFLSYNLSFSEKFFKIFDGSNKRAENLQNCLLASVRYGVSGRNLGNFLGIFQDLIRHAPQIDDTDRTGNFEWILLDPKFCPLNEHEQVLLLLRKKFPKNGIHDQTKSLKGNTETCLKCDNCDRFFAITQSDDPNNPNGSIIHIKWYSKRTCASTNTSSTPNHQITGNLSQKSQNISTDLPFRTNLTVQESTNAKNTVFGLKKLCILIIDHMKEVSPWEGRLKTAQFKRKIQQTGFIIDDTSIIAQNITGNPSSIKKPSFKFDSCLVILHIEAHSNGQDWQEKFKELTWINGVLVVSNEGSTYTDLHNKRITETENQPIIKYLVDSDNEIITPSMLEEDIHLTSFCNIIKGFL